jgi:hypothetical protein
VGSFLEPRSDGGDDKAGAAGRMAGQVPLRVDGLAPIAPPSKASAANGEVTGGQPTLLPPSLQPIYVLPANSVNMDHPSQHAETWDRLTPQVLHLLVLDAALAGLDDSLFADPLQGDLVFA